MRLTPEQFQTVMAREWRKNPPVDTVKPASKYPTSATSTPPAPTDRSMLQLVATAPLPVSEPEAKPLENDIQSAIRDGLRKHPAVAAAFRMNSGAMNIPASNGRPGRYVRFHDVQGLSDIWCWLKRPYAPRQAFIEVKRPGEKASAKQQAFLEAARAMGHIAFVASDAAEAFHRLTDELRECA